MTTAPTELAEVILGSLFIAIGLVSIVAGLSARPRRQLTVVWFAVFCLLYGVRLGANSELIQALTPWPQPLFDYIDVFVNYTRFALLPGLADRDYMMAEYWSSTKKDAAAADASWARSKRYAEQALALAINFRDHPDYGAAIYHARIALGAHALREGDKAAAVRYMLDAANAPPSPRLDGLMFFGLDTRLANYLLNAGERESVAQFLEKSAALRSADRERLLKDAAAIRAGRMPMGYQHLVTRGE